MVSPQSPLRRSLAGARSAKVGLKKSHLYRGDMLGCMSLITVFCLCSRHTPPALRATSPNLGEELLTRWKSLQYINPELKTSIEVTVL